MDVVTIVFTVVIVGIMAYVLYNQFAGGNENPSAPTASNSATAPRLSPCCLTLATFTETLQTTQT